MNYIFKIYILFIIIAISSCNYNKSDTEHNNQKGSLIDSAKWFLGTWENHTKDGLFVEAWKITNDSVYSGVSTVIVNSIDTVFYESISLQEKMHELFYIVSVKQQNKELPVSFKLTKCTAQQLVFENPKHDFPSKIVYDKVSNDSILASIHGKIDGKVKTEYFSMKKTK